MSRLPLVKNMPKIFINTCKINFCHIGSLENESYVIIIHYRVGSLEIT